MITKESFKNINLSSFIYEKSDERNIKRFSQFSKRKKALSSNKDKNGKEDIIKNNNITKKKKKNIDMINIYNFVINRNNNDFIIKKNGFQNSIFNNNSSINELKRIDGHKNIYNKENNVSKGKELNQERDNLYFEGRKGSILNQKNNIQNKGEVIVREDSYNKNEFALNFLSSTNNAFVKLGNNLKTKVKLQNNYFTESYILALDLNEQIYQGNKYQYLGNFDTIKEEKEKDEEIMENRLKKVKSLSKLTCKYHSKYGKIIKKKLNLFLDSNNNINKNKLHTSFVKDSNKNNLFLFDIDKRINDYKMRRQKTIKLNIPYYDQFFAIKNIERRKKDKNNINLNIFKY